MYKNSMKFTNLWEGIKKIFYKGVEIIYPLTCPICAQVLANKIEISQCVCEKCRLKLSYIKSPRCLKCGKPIEGDETEYCYDCSRVNHLYSQGVGVWQYTDEIKNSIYQFKYHNKRVYGQFYGMELKKCCGDIIGNWGADVLVPVPLHKSKFRKRGYNQAEIIANSFGKLISIPVDNELLYRVKKTMPQKELNDKERIKNLENTFNITKNDVRYKKVILVDDIYTTGTTIDACAKSLMDSGIKEVYYISLCIGKGF